MLFTDIDLPLYTPEPCPTPAGVAHAPTSIQFASQGCSSSLPTSASPLALVTSSLANWNSGAGRGDAGTVQASAPISAQSEKGWTGSEYPNYCYAGVSPWETTSIIQHPHQFLPMHLDGIAPEEPPPDSSGSCHDERAHALHTYSLGLKYRCEPYYSPAMEFSGHGDVDTSSSLQYRPEFDPGGICQEL